MKNKTSNGITFEEYCEKHSITQNMLDNELYTLNINERILRFEHDLILNCNLTIRCDEKCVLPSSLKVAGVLSVSGKGFTYLPEDLEVGRKLSIYKTEITEIHSGCKFNSLYIGHSPIRHIPKDLYVAGVVSITHCPGLTLPEGMNVGSLDIDTSLLDKLPKRLSVRGLLDMTGSKITEIPSDCVVGSLDAKYSSLSKLPDHWSVSGDVNLSHSSVRELPIDFHAGSLDISCTMIERIPADCCVGSLRAAGSKVRDLPDGFSVEGDVNLSHCMNITSLPSGMNIRGCLDISCTLIEKIHEVRYIGRLDAFDSSLRSLPDNFCVQGNLDLDRCKLIKALPKGLHVGGNLVISHTNIRRIPLDCKFSGLFALNSRLENIDGVDFVKGCLDLTGTNVSRLPERLIVGADFWIEHTPCKKLPKYLRVGGSMYIYDSAISEFPEDGIVAETLSMGQCKCIIPENFIVGSITYFLSSQMKAYQFRERGVDFHPNREYCCYKGMVFKVVERGEDTVRCRFIVSDDEFVLKNIRNDKWEKLQIMAHIERL